MRKRSRKQKKAAQLRRKARRRSERAKGHRSFPAEFETGGGAVEDIARELSRYDTVDLLACIAALQLVPENAARLVRLEAYAHFIASLPSSDNKPHITYRELCELFERDLVGRLVGYMEDPVECLFTQEITFDGGGYLVLPGITAGHVFIVKNICAALFLHKEKYPDETFIGDVREFVRCALRLSNMIALRAALCRGMASGEEAEKKVRIPELDRLRVLKQAVVFSEVEWRNLFGKALDGFVLDIAERKLDGNEFHNSPIPVQPVVKYREMYCVVGPNEILFAMVRWIVDAVIVNNQQSDFCELYSRAIWHRTCQNLEYMGNTQTGGPIPQLPIPFGQAGIFFLDHDKALYTVLLVDDLAGFSPEELHAFVPTSKKLSEVLERHIHSVAEYMYSMPLPPSNFMALVLVGGLGRGIAVGLNKKSNRFFPIVPFTAEALENVACKCRGDSLELWNYAKALEELENRNTRMISTDSLDQYELYRGNDKSFYVSDEAKPTHILAGPGMGGKLRIDVARERDSHCAFGCSDNACTEVVRLHSKEVPIYVPSGSPKGPVKIFVENDEIPLWVIQGDSPGSEHDHADLDYFHFCDGVAYWLWQLEPIVTKTFKVIALRHPILRIVIYRESEAKPNDSKTAEKRESPVTVVAEPSKHEIHVTVHPALQEVLLSSDNAGERYLMQQILESLSEFLAEPDKALLNEETIGTALDTYAPLGNKKKLFAIDVGKNPMACSVTYPAYRKISSATEHRLLGEIGQYLTDVKMLLVGRIGSKEEQVTLLNDLVSYLFGRLIRYISTLRPDGMIEWLIGHQEAVAVETKLTKIYATTAPACYGDTQEYFDEVKKKFPEHSTVRMANRFIIEYISACPPKGFRPISFEVYDDLLALAKTIIDYGAFSDFLHYGLADLELEILPSGRLGRNLDAFEKPRLDYLNLYTSGQLLRAQNSFPGHWNDSRVENARDDKAKVTMQDMDNATQAEWGVCLSDIMTFLGEVLWSNLKEGQACWIEEKDTFISKYSSALEWPVEKTTKMLEFLSLGPRKFLPPDEPFGLEDVYPWRLDRKLSYVWRPFVQRVSENKVEVLWGCRHLYQTSEYYSDFITSGRLEGNSNYARILNGKINDSKGKEFSRKVGAYMRSLFGDRVREEVKKIGKLRVPGDIDVLAACPDRKRVYVIECKDFESARTPHELHSELKKFFEGQQGKKSAIEKHINRVKWVRQNLEGVLTALGWSQDIDWIVTDFLVTDDEMMTPHFKECPVQIIPWSKLQLSGLPL